MTVVSMRDSTTDGLMFVRPIPQGSAPPGLGAFWTDEYGWLVPDTRLQDITAAQKCEHGMINGHPTDDPYHPYVHGLVKNWCPGAPKLRSLLDALIKEDNDD